MSKFFYICRNAGKPFSNHEMQLLSTLNRRMDMALEAEFKVEEDVLIVRLQGELDHHEAEQLRERWKDEIYHHSVKHVLLNLRDITFMDSSGLGVVLGRYKEVLQLGGQFVVCSITAPIERLFEMSGLFKIVKQAEDEHDALHALGVIVS